MATVENIQSFNPHIIQSIFKNNKYILSKPKQDKDRIIENIFNNLY